MIHRQRCIELLYSQTPLFVTLEQFSQVLDGWEMDPVLRQDGSIGIVFVVKGPEFHFAKFGEDVQASREHLKKYPGELIERFGYALTQTPQTATRQIRFNKRLGFFVTHEDEFNVHFRIEHLRKKETSCQSSQ